MTLTYGSVCSGIEAATVAWHPLGMKPRWFAELSPFPSAVLAHHYPEIPNYGDFTSLLQARPADVDVLVGGTPCQSFSVAGLRGGFADPRGNLALAFVALVGALRPRWVVWENVPGVLSVDGGRAFGSFLGGLAELGYGWAYRVMDAQYFGLAQRRKRVFVVASPGDWRRPAQVLFEPESVRRDLAPRRETGAGVAGSLGTGASASGGWRVGADEAAAGHAVPVDLQNTTIGGDVAGTLDCSRPGRGGGQGVLTAFGGGNAVGPIDVATTCLAKGGTGRMDFECEAFIAHTAPVAYMPARTLAGDGGIDERFAPRDVCDALHRSSGNGNKAPLIHAEPQTFAWQVQGTNRTDIHDMPGRARTLGTQGLAVRERRGVRRLLPHEMERLQGFPDHYTLLPDQQRRAVEDDYAAWYAARFPHLTREAIERLSKDGPRAKALGNSMAVPVMRWIGRRLQLVDGVHSQGAA